MQSFSRRLRGGVLALALMAGPALAQTASIAIGTNPNDGTGDTLRVAFGKVNSNFGLLGSAAFKPASAFDPAGAAAAAVAGLNLTGAVSSVAGRTGAVVLTHSDISDWTSALSPYALTSSLGSAAFMPASAFAPAGSGEGVVSSVAGRTGAVTLTHGDITDWASTLASYALTSSLGSAASQPSSAFDAAGAASSAQTAAVASAKTYTQGYLASLPSCTAGSSVAPVPTGSPFLCAGVLLIAQ